MLTGSEIAARTGLDAAAVKPSECAVEEAVDLPFDLVTIDYEGAEHVPSAETLRRLALAIDVRVTVSVRADGFDPLGDDAGYRRLPDDVGLVLVAGHPAYLSGNERRRAVVPRLTAALERSPNAWVGTEGIERAALATGATQFDLLSPTTERDLRALRTAGFSGEIAVYAPTVLADDPDAVLDAVGDYVARRGPVGRALPTDAPTGSDAAGRVRETLLGASRDYALIGDDGAVADRVAALKASGADRVVGYPARGLGAFCD